MLVGVCLKYSLWCSVGCLFDVIAAFSNIFSLPRQLLGHADVWPGKLNRITGVQVSGPIIETHLVSILIFVLFILKGNPRVTYAVSSDSYFLHRILQNETGKGKGDAHNSYFHKTVRGKKYETRENIRDEPSWPMFFQLNRDEIVLYSLILSIRGEARLASPIPPHRRLLRIRCSCHFSSARLSRQQFPTSTTSIHYSRLRFATPTHAGRRRSIIC